MIQELGAAEGLRRRPLGPVVPGRRRRRTRRSRAPRTSRSTRSSSATRRSATTRSTPPTRMKDGTVVNEQAAFKGYIQQRRRLRRAPRAPTTRCTTGRLVQGPARRPVRRAPGQRRAASAPTAAPATGPSVSTEDPTHPSHGRRRASRERAAVADELYHFDRKPRLYMHPLHDAQRGHVPRRRSASAPPPATSRAAITRSRAARTTTAAASGRRSSATTGSSSKHAVVPRERLPGHPHRGRPEARQLRHARRGQDAAGLAADVGRHHRRRRDAGHGARSRARSTSTRRWTQARLSVVARATSTRCATSRTTRPAATLRRAPRSWPRRRSSRAGWASCSAPRTSAATRPAPCRRRWRSRSARRPTFGAFTPGVAQDVHGELDGQRHLDGG